jgi:hypothetical protein
VELANSRGGLNAYRYVPGRDPSAALPAGAARIVVEEAGPLVATLRVESTAPGATRLVRRVTLVAGDDRAWLETAIDKTKVRAKESGHIEFGFKLASPVVRVDQGEALVTIGKDQLPGSCNDFIGVHSAVDVSSEGAGVSVATLDAPLMELGSITDERREGSLPRAWRKQADAGGTVLAYLFNNYWHTNYKADQEGRLRFRFALRPHEAFDPAALRRLGAAVDNPLVVSRIASSAAVTPPPFRLTGPALVSALRPLEGGRGLLVRLYNPTPAPVTAGLEGLWRGRVTKVVEAGGKRETSVGAIELKPFASVVLEITRAD